MLFLPDCHGQVDSRGDVQITGLSGHHGPNMAGTCRPGLSGKGHFVRATLSSNPF
jgi:hypothetical protein